MCAVRHSPVRDYLINLAAASILQISDRCGPLLQSVGSSPAPASNDCVDSVLHLLIGFSDMPAKYLDCFVHLFLHQKRCCTLQRHCNAAHMFVFICYCTNTPTFWLIVEQAHIFIHKMKACTWERGAEGAAALPADKGEV